MMRLAAAIILLTLAATDAQAQTAAAASPATPAAAAAPTCTPGQVTTFPPENIDECTSSSFLQWVKGTCSVRCVVFSNAVNNTSDTTPTIPTTGQ